MPQKQMQIAKLTTLQFTKGNCKLLVFSTHAQYEARK